MDLQTTTLFPEEKIQQLLESWRQSSELESEAIEAQNWDEVGRFQKQKSALQIEIIAATNEFESELLNFRKVRFHVRRFANKSSN
jgi:hypothetical protein